MVSLVLYREDKKLIDNFGFKTAPNPNPKAFGAMFLYDPQGNLCHNIGNYTLEYLVKNDFT